MKGPEDNKFLRGFFLLARLSSLVMLQRGYRQGPTTQPAATIYFLFELPSIVVKP
jgi:hypothetical protein